MESEMNVNLNDPSTLFAVTCPACYSFSLNIKSCTRCHINIPSFINVKAIGKVGKGIEIIEITEERISSDSTLKNILQQRVDSTSNSMPQQSSNSKGFFVDPFKEPTTHTHEDHVEVSAPTSANTCDLPQDSSLVLDTNNEDVPESMDADVGQMGPDESMDAANACMDHSKSMNVDDGKQIKPDENINANVGNEMRPVDTDTRNQPMLDESIDPNIGNQSRPDKSMDTDIGNPLRPEENIDADVENQMKPDTDNSNSNMTL